MKRFNSQEIKAIRISRARWRHRNKRRFHPCVCLARDDFAALNFIVRRLLRLKELE